MAAPSELWQHKQCVILTWPNKHASEGPDINITHNWWDINNESSQDCNVNAAMRSCGPRVLLEREHRNSWMPLELWEWERERESAFGERHVNCYFFVVFLVLNVPTWPPICWSKGSSELRDKRCPFFSTVEPIVLENMSLLNHSYICIQHLDERMSEFTTRKITLIQKEKQMLLVTNNSVFIM